jgi:CubicO group peptidase (beta-lactamase class C family)
MANRERVIVALSVVFGSLALTGCGRPATVQQLLPSELRQPDQIIDWNLERLIKKGFPGAAVIVSQNGQILYQKGFGYSDVEHSIPITPETEFRIGSITKQFTAAAILKLQENGKLSLNDKLSTFIPDYPRGDEVTIHHLLTHTSGIPSYTSKPDFRKTLTFQIDPLKLIDSLKNDTFVFDPGELHIYSNSGYFLLGYIIEKISSKSLQDYLKETFFDPLDPIQA